MVSAMDDGIGRVLNTLKETNMEENTIVVFFQIMVVLHIKMRLKTIL